jgi:uncharacterized protein (TIGR00369 family)
MSASPPSDEHDAVLQRLDSGFSAFVPHNRALGLRFVGYGDGEAMLRLPYDPKLVGNPETGVLHGGAITSLLDAACGAAVFVKLWDRTPIATLELRIDYLKPAAPFRDVIAKATCFKLTRNVAFVRAVAFHDSEGDPIASASGTFMLQTPGQSAMPAAGGAKDEVAT